MKINYNGFSARLYRRFYDTNDMPESLCGYFWKLVAAYILYIPLLIIGIPGALISKYLLKVDMGFPLNVGVTIVLAFFTCVLYILTMPILHICLSKTLSEIDAIGLSIDFILLVIIIACLILVKDNLIKKYVSAKIKKVCPRIEWTNDNTKNT